MECGSLSEYFTCLARQRTGYVAEFFEQGVV
jgi:hypothetical protein